MPHSPHAHADAVAAVDNWLTISKQKTSLGASARQFVEDLRNNQKTREWSKVNVEQILPFKSETPRLLLVVRAGAMFLPILLTWLALSQVIGPFALYLQNQQASANFLWFWNQNPGKSFAGVWKLSHVALTDAAILAFLTVLAMPSLESQGRPSRRQQEQQTRTRDDQTPVIQYRVHVTPHRKNHLELNPTHQTHAGLAPLHRNLHHTMGQ